MTPASDGPSTDPRRRILALLPMALGACALALIGWCGLQRALAFGPPSAAATIVDFDLFHLVGHLVLEGRLGEAYRLATLQGLEGRMSLDAARSIPFAYPPPFALAMAVLAPLPVWAGYAIFMVLGFALLAAALWRISAAWFWPAALAMSPAVFVNVVIGQNGMLTAGLAGLAALLAVERRSGAAGALAGVLAGVLAALKPQTCVALPLLFVGRSAWRALALMAATATALGALSLAVLGPAILPAFLGALSETSQALAQGRFQLHRMTSVYACLRSLGAAADVAMALHAAAALAILGLVARAARGLDDARAASGLTVMAGCFVSPYFYDYDVTVAGLGLALALPALSRSGGRWRAAGALSLLVLAESVGVVETVALPFRVSLGAPLLLTCLAAVLSWLTRRDASRPATACGEVAPTPV